MSGLIVLLPDPLDAFGFLVPAVSHQPAPMCRHNPVPPQVGGALKSH